MSPEDLASNWVCAKCDGQSLERGSVRVAYMGGVYTVELLRCPRCGLVFVPEEMAMGKMAEAEQALEDK
ncbi:MAG: DNA-binding protein [Desulfobacterales bacterium]|nr:DNA-binding protein [Desulfobacterales bacterium]